MILLIESLLQKLNEHGITKLSYEYHDNSYNLHQSNNKQHIIWFKELSNYYYPELLDYNNVDNLVIKEFGYGRFGWYVKYQLPLNEKEIITNLEKLK